MTAPLYQQRRRKCEQPAEGYRYEWDILHRSKVIGRKTAISVQIGAPEVRSYTFGGRVYRCCDEFKAAYEASLKEEAA